MEQSDKFWMVYGEGQGAPTVRHESYETAKREAERLSRSVTGTRFFVMMPVSVSRRVDVDTKMLVDFNDVLPF